MQYVECDWHEVKPDRLKVTATGENECEQMLRTERQPELAA